MQAELSLKHAVDFPTSTPYPHDWFLPTPCPTSWLLQSCPWLPRATEISCSLHGHLAQSLGCWVLLFTDERLKFPATSGQRHLVLSTPLCNSTRPSAQHMEVVVQNRVSWLILSVALSNVLWFHQQVGRQPSFIAWALISLRRGLGFTSPRNADTQTVMSGPLGQCWPMSQWAGHFWFRESNFLNQNNSNYWRSHQFKFACVGLH